MSRFLAYGAPSGVRLASAPADGVSKVSGAGAPEGMRLVSDSDPNTYVPDAPCNGISKSAGHKSGQPCKMVALAGESYCKYHLPRLAEG